MLKPNFNDLKLLISYGPKEFEEWLQDVLENELNGQGFSNKKFEPLNAFLGQDVDITEDLKNIYDKLPKDAKKKFKKGMKSLLSHLPRENRYLSIFEEILFLTGEIKCYDIIEILPETLGNNGFLSIASEQDKERIFVAALETIASMATPGEQNILDCIKTLIHSQYFFPEYADTAFIALCQITPKDFPEHLRLVRGYINHLIKSERVSLEQIQDVGYQFIECVTINHIAENLCKLDLLSENNDKWFVQALFNGDASPLIIDIKYEDFLSVTRRDSNVRLSEYVKLDQNPRENSEILMNMLRFYNRQNSLRAHRARPKNKFIPKDIQNLLEILDLNKGNYCYSLTTDL